MSLIQDAFDRASAPEPEPETDKILEEVRQAVAREPRLETIKFYETFTTPLENDLNQIKKFGQSKAEEKVKTIYLSPNQLILILMGVLLAGSLIASRFMFRSVNSTAASEVTSAPVHSERSSRPVVVTTRTPVTNRTVSQMKFTLTGVTASGETRLALINDQVVGVGDPLREKATVKSIEPNSVTLEYEGHPVILTL